MLSKFVFTALTGAALIMSSPAMAAKCKDMKVRIWNHERELMRVLKIRAYNSEDRKWRTIRTSNFEAFAAQPNQPVATTVTDNVSNSEGERIAIRVQYRFHFGSNDTRYRADSAYAVCGTDRVYTVTIPNSGHIPYN